MFDDIRKGLTADKEAFAEQVKDSFGQSVVSQVYEPCQRETALWQGPGRRPKCKGVRSWL